MTTYIRHKKDMVFQSLNSLKTVEHLFSEIDAGLGNSSRTINNSSMPEVLAASLGVGTGGAISFAALYLGGSVVGVSSAGVASALTAAGAIIGGGSSVGVFIIAAPFAILSFLGLKFALRSRAKRLKTAKTLCYKRALVRLALIKDAISASGLEETRKEYLRALSITLQAAIIDLKHDLGII